MEFFQKEVRLKPYPRGFHLITDTVEGALPQLGSMSVGILQIFLKHTSASLTVNENADPTVRGDLQRHLDALVPENVPYYEHRYEGPDDMPAHIKASLLGCSVQLPISGGRLNLGTWQGIYLGEHRDHAPGRKLVITAFGQRG